MKFVSIDKGRFPVVVVKMHHSTPSQEEFDYYLAQMEKIYSDHSGLIVIYDTEKLRYLESKYRIQLGKWLKTNQELISHAVKGAGYVMNNPIASMMLKGIFMIQTPKWPHKVLPNFEAALHWAENFQKQ